MIGGISGYKVTYSFQTKPEGSKSTTLYASDGIVIKNKKRYSVSLSSFNQKLLESKQTMFDQILSTFKFIDQTINPDQDAVNNVVKNFYNALESQDGKVLFSYFTQPATSQEKESFNWLTGADIAGTPIYRAFFRQKISDPKIVDTQKINDTTFLVKISDQLVGIPSAGGETKLYTPQPRNVLITMIKSGNTWLVDKYTDPSNTSNSGNAGAPKYNGFGQ